MFLWIDPPGDNPGWIHTLSGEVTGAAVKEITGRYREFPSDNTARQIAQDFAGGPDRDWWGVTLLDALPTDLPHGIVMVDDGPGDPE